jgi:hypothetical protein
MSRISLFLYNRLTDGGEFVSLERRPQPFISRTILDSHDASDTVVPRATIRMGGLGQLIEAITSCTVS